MRKLFLLLFLTGCCGTEVELLGEKTHQLEMVRVLNNGKYGIYVREGNELKQLTFHHDTNYHVILNLSPDTPSYVKVKEFHKNHRFYEVYIYVHNAQEIK